MIMTNDNPQILVKYCDIIQEQLGSFIIFQVKRHVMNAYKIKSFIPIIISLIGA